MGALEPAGEWDEAALERLLERLELALRVRRMYRSGGKPCPGPVRGLWQHRQHLAQLERELRSRIPQELEDATHKVMADIYTDNEAFLATETHRTNRGGTSGADSPHSK